MEPPAPGSSPSPEPEQSCNTFCQEVPQSTCDMRDDDGPPQLTVSSALVIADQPSFGDDLEGYLAKVKYPMPLVEPRFQSVRHGEKGEGLYSFYGQSTPLTPSPEQLGAKKRNHAAERSSQAIKGNTTASATFSPSGGGLSQSTQQKKLSQHDQDPIGDGTENLEQSTQHQREPVYQHDTGKQSRDSTGTFGQTTSPRDKDDVDLTGNTRHISPSSKYSSSPASEAEAANSGPPESWKPWTGDPAEFNPYAAASEPLTSPDGSLGLRGGEETAEQSSKSDSVLCNPLPVGGRKCPRYRLPEFLNTPLPDDWRSKTSKACPPNCPRVLPKKAQESSKAKKENPSTQPAKPATSYSGSSSHHGPRKSDTIGLSTIPC